MSLRSDDIDQTIQGYERTWKQTDMVLYALCRDHPGHDEPCWVFTKVAMIDRVYAAGLSRLSKVNGQSGALPRTATRLLERHNEIAELLSTLPVHASLNAKVLAMVLVLHRRFVDLLRPIARNGRSARSFASKYLHFHRPVVPMFDNVVTRSTHLPPASQSPTLPAVDSMDVEYARYLRRFFTFYNGLREAGVPEALTTRDAHVTLVRLADYILWRPEAEA